ncbi:MAG: toxin-antitoxin system HicB family antitoxin [Actinomycetota bacterium]|nr:toxin-antitoxin system HicB family antitoxin [Actinomycetota bacterium]
MTDRKSFLLRINPRLHRVLERWAAEDLRSLNSQIEFLLVEAAKKNGRWTAKESIEGPDEA